MTNTLKPETSDQVIEAIRGSLAEQQALDVVAGGSKARLGRPPQARHRLDVSALSGIVQYEPEELVLTARAGTPIAEIEAAMAAERQQLAFEPPNLGALLETARPAGDGTLGGAIACNASGPRRIKAGAARDHVLGFSAVSGRGEAFKSGGRVVKNVTGFDLSKLIAGSFGTLAVMTEVSVRALPAPADTQTLLLLDASDAEAVRAMTLALQTPCEVSGAAHLPRVVAAKSMVAAVFDAGGPVTAIRLEGAARSVGSRVAVLRTLLAPLGLIRVIGKAELAALWAEIRDVWYFLDVPDWQVWRLSVPPAAGATVAHSLLHQRGGLAYYDWGGGLIWLALPPTDDARHGIVRAAMAACGGDATLIRAEPLVRAHVPVFQPRSDALTDLAARVKQGFDPHHVLNPGRMYPGS